MKKVGLFFGSFNPIHIGHLVIAEYMVEFTPLEQIWFVVSPQNPLKKKESLLSENNRIHMVRIAIEDDSRFKASNIEFSLPRPSYTIDTLVHLTEKYPKVDFSLIIGHDNLSTLPKWKNYEALLRNYKLYVYPRISSAQEKSILETHPSVIITNAPIVELSSTFIRKAIAEGKTIKHMVPPKVGEYIDEMNYYKK
ncbi:MAG TPA: nicotinate (nicotinamide) nucleotide adenylyltransferase [Bacteroidia bacterium]|jgi:nicotinate-nucleotide adenylyltransferase|nr:nicotinate (nicotinamide) nucleotide adenylyltransferase [Bacteroidia bacterium]